jgi:hypothetical protein
MASAPIGLDFDRAILSSGGVYARQLGWNPVAVCVILLRPFSPVDRSRNCRLARSSAL